MTSLNSQLAASQANLASVQGQVSSLQNQLATTSTQIPSLQTQLSTANAQVTALQSQLSTANSQVTALQSQVNSLTAQLAAIGSNTSTSNTSTQIMGSTSIGAAPGARSAIASFTASATGYISITGYSSTANSYIMTTNSSYGNSANYTLNTASSTFSIPVQPGTVTVYFGNSDTVNTATAYITNVVYYSTASTTSATSNQIVRFDIRDRRSRRAHTGCHFCGQHDRLYQLYGLQLNCQQLHHDYQLRLRQLSQLSVRHRQFDLFHPGAAGHGYSLFWQ